MIKIGLIGEDPNDTTAITHLMKQKFGSGYHFFALSTNKTGSQIFNPPAVKGYNFKIQKEKPKHVIVIIDADATETEQNKIKIKKEKYKQLKEKLDCKSLLLLNTYELEALILADIEGFNSRYQTNVTYAGNVSRKDKPKEFLQRETNYKYQVSHCSKLFQHLNFDTIQKNCAYFDAFIKDFEAALKK